ncbi:TlyA family RNA methyltransferase [Polycladospora coralii]|uniref:TlyA family RNA methyltransferase n=1 Tax=Polycladospora coralii TaxID=2771432 RepID=UPI0034E27E3C
MVKKERVDVLLVQKGHFETRQQAQRSIMAGLVYVENDRIDKAGTKVPVDASMLVKGQLHPYVSRGGLKLEKALQVFPIQLQDRVMMDIGASTGGFTDCALQQGVKMVYAIDVGYGQLAWKLRQDPRVIVMERTNFRYLTEDELTNEKPDFAVIDVSFISLSLIFPTLKNVCKPNTEGIALVKPQFEAGREHVGKKGIVRDPTIHQLVLHQFVKTVTENNLTVKGLTVSPIQGSEGNIEFLGYFSTEKQTTQMDWSSVIDEVVKEAHHTDHT